MVDINPISSEEDLKKEANSGMPDPLNLAPAQPATPVQGTIANGPIISQAAVPVNRPIVPQYTPVHSAILEDTTKRFVYDLPIFSYVLAWLYGLVTLYLFINYMPIIFRSSFESFMVASIIPVLCIIMIFLLIKGGLVRWSAALTISIGASGYLSFLIITSMSSSMGYGYDSNIFSYLRMIFAFSPYFFLPFISLIYLLTPKARLAYK